MRVGFSSSCTEKKMSRCGCVWLLKIVESCLGRTGGELPSSLTTTRTLRAKPLVASFPFLNLNPSPPPSLVSLFSSCHVLSISPPPNRLVVAVFRCFWSQEVALHPRVPVRDASQLGQSKSLLVSVASKGKRAVGEVRAGLSLLRVCWVN